MDDLLYRVYLPREQLLRLVVRCPALLMMSARTVQAKIEGLQVGGGWSSHALALARVPWWWLGAGLAV